MTDKVIENNQVIIMGEIISDFQFSHEIFGEGFYMVDVNVPRLSDSCDVIPLMVSSAEHFDTIKMQLRSKSPDLSGLFVCGLLNLRRALPPQAPLLLCCLSLEHNF